MIESYLSPDWLSRFRHCMHAATVMIQAADAKLEEQKQRDLTCWVAIHQDELSAGLTSSDWDIPRMGLVGDKRMQRTDGNSWTAGLVLLAHYPPAHPSKHALCANRDGGAMLLAGGLSSPSVTGNFQLAFENVVPLFFDLENGEKGMKVVDSRTGKSKSYPLGIIKNQIGRKSKDILDRVASGSSQLILSFGANPREACLNAVRSAEASSDFEVTSITIQARKVRDWETGSLCLRTLLLRQMHSKATRDIGIQASLFGNANFDDKEKLDVTMNERAIHAYDHLEYKLYFLSHRDFPDRCSVIFPQDHMSFATDTRGNSSLDIGTKLDVGISFAEDLFFNRFATGMFPPPTWRFTPRKVLSLLIEDEEKEKGIHTIGLTQGMCNLLSELKRFRGTNINVDYLPPKFRNFYRCLTYEESAQGLLLDVSSPVDVILAGNQRRLQRYPTNAPKSARSVTPILANPPPTSARSTTSSQVTHHTPAPPSSSAPLVSNTLSVDIPAPSTATASTPHYSSICECGTKSATPINASTGGAVVREYKIGTGSVHKPIHSKQRYPGMHCLTGIPVEERLVSSALFIGVGKRKPVAQPDTVKTRVAAARRKFL